MDTDSLAIKAYKWELAIAIVIAVLATFTEYKVGIINKVQSIWDITKRPCVGRIYIEYPHDGNVVYEDLLVVEGVAKLSPSCKKVVLILEPFSGPRSKFVSDVQDFSGGANKENWSATARLWEIPAGSKFRLTARMCSNEHPYPNAGCVCSSSFGIASNSIILKKGE